MRMIYSSEHFWILSYPAQQGVELFDKERKRLLFLQGDAAWSFRYAMEQIPEAERDEETIDAFLDDYCDDKAQPITLH